jgi:hypothetical protein
MPPLGFEPTIPASARPQTHVLDGAATGIGNNNILQSLNITIFTITQLYRAEQISIIPFVKKTTALYEAKFC